MSNILNVGFLVNRKSGSGSIKLPLNRAPTAATVSTDESSQHSREDETAKLLWEKERNDKNVASTPAVVDLIRDAANNNSIATASASAQFCPLPPAGKAPSRQLVWHYNPRWYLLPGGICLIVQSLRCHLVYLETTTSTMNGGSTAATQMVWQRIICNAASLGDTILVIIYCCLLHWRLWRFHLRKHWYWKSSSGDEGCASSGAIASVATTCDNNGNYVEDECVQHSCHQSNMTEETLANIMQVISKDNNIPIHCIAILCCKEPIHHVCNLVRDVIEQPSYGPKVVILAMEKITPNRVERLREVQAVIQECEAKIAAYESDLEASRIRRECARQHLGQYSGESSDDYDGNDGCDKPRRYSRSITRLLYTVHELAEGEIAGTGANHFSAVVAAEQFFPKSLHSRVIFTKIDCNTRISRNTLVEIEDCWSNLGIVERLGANFAPVVWMAGQGPDVNFRAAEHASVILQALNVLGFSMSSIVSGSLAGAVLAGYPGVSLLAEDANMVVQRMLLLPKAENYRLNCFGYKTLNPPVAHSYEFLNEVWLPKMKRWFMGNLETLFLITWWNLSRHTCDARSGSPGRTTTWPRIMSRAKALAVIGEGIARQYMFFVNWVVMYVSCKWLDVTAKPLEERGFYDLLAFTLGLFPLGFWAGIFLLKYHLHKAFPPAAHQAKSIRRSSTNSDSRAASNGGDREVTSLHQGSSVFCPEQKRTEITKPWDIGIHANYFCFLKGFVHSLWVHPVATWYLLYGCYLKHGITGETIAHIILQDTMLPGGKGTPSPGASKKID